MDVTFEWYNMKETAVNEKEGNWSRELFLQQGIWTVPLTISLYLKIFAKADNYMGLGGGGGAQGEESVWGRDKVFSTDIFVEDKIQLQNHSICMAPLLLQRRLASLNTPEFITLPIIRKAHTKQYPKQTGIHAFLISHSACQYHTHSTEFRPFSSCFG